MSECSGPDCTHPSHRRAAVPTFANVSRCAICGEGIRVGDSVRSRVQPLDWADDKRGQQFRQTQTSNKQQPTPESYDDSDIPF